MSKHYQATHDGHTWKRSTKGRSYTHCIIVKQSVESVKAGLAKHAKWDWDNNHEWYKDVAEGKPYIQQWDGVPKPRTEEEIADAKARITMGRDAFIAAAVAGFDPSDYLVSSDGLSVYYIHGWCGRLDLALKQAKGNRIILEAVQVK